MRLAGSQELHDTLVGQEAGQNATNKLEAFIEAYELLKSKGYSDKLADHTAKKMVNGEEPMAKLTTRFAGVYDGIQDPRDSSSTDRGI